MTGSGGSGAVGGMSAGGAGGLSGGAGGAANGGSAGGAPPGIGGDCCAPLGTGGTGGATLGGGGAAGHPAGGGAAGSGGAGGHPAGGGAAGSGGAGGHPAGGGSGGAGGQGAHGGVGGGAAGSGGAGGKAGNTAQICTPGEHACLGSALYVCNTAGTARTQQILCAAGTYCDVPTLGCLPQICTPQDPACDGQVATTCNITGSGYEGTRTDCSATPGQHCESGMCTSLTTATVGSPQDTGAVGSSEMTFNFYAVTVNVALAEIDEQLETNATTNVAWAVYDAGTNPQDEYYLVSWAEMYTFSSYYTSSGPISVPLLAGHNYAIGISVLGSSLFYSETGALPQTTSFGTLISAGSYSGAPPPSTGIPWRAPAGFFYPQILKTQH